MLSCKCTPPLFCPPCLLLSPLLLLCSLSPSLPPSLHLCSLSQERTNHRVSGRGEGGGVSKHVRQGEDVKTGRGKRVAKETEELVSVFGSRPERRGDNCFDFLFLSSGAGLPVFPLCNQMVKVLVRGSYLRWRVNTERLQGHQDGTS